MRPAELPATLVLRLPGAELDLMADGGPFRVASVDLSFPDVRADENPRPDAHGVLDNTRYVGARAVTIAGSIVNVPPGARRAALRDLGPFLDPGARPVLTFALDEGDEPRSVTLRADALTAPFAHPVVTQFALSYKAPDGVLYSAEQFVVIVGASSTRAGRSYPLTYPREYPPASAPDFLHVTARGSVASVPRFQLSGPATEIDIVGLNVATGATWRFALRPSFRVELNQELVIDCRARTIELDGRNAYGEALATFTDWPELPANQTVRLQLNAAGVSDATTRLVMTWADSWLV